jgi:hypothetical protein
MTTTTAGGAVEDRIRQAAAAALADVDALGAEGEDRKILLRAILQARLPLSPVQTSGPPTSAISTADGQPAAKVSTPAMDPEDPIARICSALNVDRDLIDLVYAIQDGEPHVVVSAKKIAQNKSQGARELAQLIAAARQACGLDEWTSVGTIRKVVSDYGRLDSANFSTSIQQMDKVALIRGKGQQRELKITKPGFEATAELVRALAGSDA